MRRSEQEATTLHQALGRYLDEIGMGKRSREVLAAVVWAETVGPWYARHTAVAKVEDGVLTIHCDSAPHAQQLQADSEKILARLNRRVSEQWGPGQHVKELRATSAWMGRDGQRRFAKAGKQAPPFTSEEIDAIELTAEEERRIEGLAAELEDEALRRRFAATIRASLRARKWQLRHGYRECPECGGLLAPGETECWICRIPQ